ncbi:type IV toxin-antitoxin system AbiEi family antitoxin domain-containing protein [bacterium]|nr:type IV toxin-antitoxin system AbiEi family antitoxin domain-containing protein [bacterium]
MVANTEKLERLIADRQFVRARDLDGYGIPRMTLTRLVERGYLRRVARGLYMSEEHEVTHHHYLARLAKLVPDGVICLLTALRFHELGTQNPWQVWVAIDRTARKPHIRDLPLNFVRFSGAALTHGVETHRIEGVDVHVTTPAKTVADCFKYRNKVGLDVATEALWDFRRDRRGTIDDLLAAARVCRVEKIIMPFIQMTI